MNPGDVALLTEKGTRKFTHCAQIIHKLESESLGNHLWPFTPSLPWKLIYVLTNLSVISVDKSQLVRSLGYKSNDNVAGTRRVKDEYLSRVLERHGSLGEFLDSVAGEPLGITLMEGELPAAAALEGKIKSGAGFGDPKINRLVERAAIHAVTKEYERKGWAVTSVEAAKCGYDLLCKKAGKEDHVEVKGVRGTGLSFIITAGEVRQARKDPNFVICVVTAALTETPSIQSFTGEEFLNGFLLEELAFRASKSPKTR